MIVATVINMAAEAVEVQGAQVPMLQVELVVMVATLLFKVRHKEIA